MINSLEAARNAARSMFEDTAVVSVDVDSWIGVLRVFRDGTIRFAAECEDA